MSVDFLFSSLWLPQFSVRVIRCFCSFCCCCFLIPFRKVIFLPGYFYYPSSLSPGAVEELRKHRKTHKWGCFSIQHYYCLKISTTDGDKNNFHQQCRNWKLSHYKPSRRRMFVKRSLSESGQCHGEKQGIVMFEWKHITTTTAERSRKQKDVNARVQWELSLWMSSCPEGPLIVQEHNYCHRRIKVK